MKKIILIICLFINYVFLAQVDKFGGTPVKGIIAIKGFQDLKDNSADASNSKAAASRLAPSNPTGSSQEVGITEGQLSVSLTGGANYVVPIAIPPGINGVMPQVNLGYSSQSGNGLAGYGWNVGGLSAITRIASTIYHDGVIDGVDFDNLDRFALDGQRLISKTVGVYGANGTVYETENFSNIKITSIGVHPSGGNFGPEKFIVHYPDGSAAEYGLTSNSRTITTWAITYMQNSQGVRINYDYINANNNLLINKITYGTLGLIPGLNEIRFIYKTRQRPEQAYVEGKSIIINQILSEIKVIGTGIGFRNYYLAHNATSLGYERLISITEKNGDNSKSLNPTIFTYEETSNIIEYNTTSTSLAYGNISMQNSATVSGDFNGDGKMDFILTGSSGSGSIYRLFDSLSTNSTNIGWQHNIQYEQIFAGNSLIGDNLLGYKLAPMQSWTVVSHSGTKFRTFLNGITLSTGTPFSLQSEIDVSYPLRNIQYCAINDATLNCELNDGVTGSAKKIISGDFNGDGLTDVMAIEHGIIPSAYACNTYYDEYGSLNCTSESGSYIPSEVFFINLDKRIAGNNLTAVGSITPINGFSKIEVIDFNGDGKSDFLVLEQGRISVYTLNNTNNSLIKLYQSIDPAVNPIYPVLIGDYNGDGKSDFIIPVNYGNTYLKFSSNGLVFLREVINYSIPYHKNNENNTFYIFPNDMNNDGKTDLILAKNYKGDNGFISVNIFKNINDTFIQDIFATTNWQSDIILNPLPIIISPLKTNSNLEIGFISNSRIHRFKSHKDYSKDKLLKTITTGFGVTDAITYKPMQSESCSFNCNAVYAGVKFVENYPNTDILVAPTFSLVTKLERQSNSVYSKQLFSYYGATSNLEGLGFLGFRATTKTNWHTDEAQIISNVTRNDISLRGAAIENFSVVNFYLPSNTLPSTSFINKTLSTYNIILSPTKVFKIQNTNAITYNGLDNTSKESTTTFDAYKNPLANTTLTKLGGTLEQTETVIVDYDLPTTTPYIIGRPKQKNTSVTHNSDTTTGEEIYGYNANNLLSQIKKKGHGTNYIVEDNEYDTFGNITKKTITASPLAPRVTNYQYDSSGRFLIKSTDIETLNTHFEYDPANGFLKSETNPYGLQTKYFYDTWGKKIKTTDYLNKNAYYTYTIPEPKYSIITTTSDDGSASMSKFDDLGREILSGVKNIDDQWSYTKTEYDAYNRKIKTTEPHHYQNGLPTTYTYDVYGRLIKTVDPSAKVTDITYSGLTATVSDGFKTVATTNNSLGKAVSVTDNGGTINYTYFASGNLKNSNFEGTVINMEYDGWGRKTKLTDPSAGMYRYEYNPLGELTKEIKPHLKGEIAYNLDNFGKIAEKIVTSPDGLTNNKTIYSYDPTSKLAISTRFEDYTENTVTEYEYTYDAYKRVVKTTEKNPATANFEHETTYDAFGRTDKERLYAINNANAKASSKWIKHTYKNGSNWQIIDDATNQVLWQTNVVTERGQLGYGVMGNGIQVINTYDQLGFPTEFKHQVTTTPLIIDILDPLPQTTTNIMTLGMEFEHKRGNLLSRTNSMFGTTQTITEDTPEGPVTTTINIPLLEKFKYDALNRLTEWGAAQEEIVNIDFFKAKPILSELPPPDPLYQFVPVNTGVISNVLSKLNVATTAAVSGTEREVLTSATLGTKLKVNVEVSKLTTDKIRVVAVEKDATTLVETQYELGLANEGAFEATHVVVNNNANIYFRFDKSPLSTDVGALTNFRIDNFVITKILGETQSYDNKGRITQNRLGSYNYTTVAKKYQNTSVITTDEANNYYATKPLQSITYNAFKGPVQITEGGIDKISFTYNTFNDRAAMYYGGLQTDKLQRTHRKFYSASGAMEIKYNKDSGETELITYIGGDAYTAPIVLKSDGTTQEYLYLHRDYQGSIMAITNQDALVLEKRHYDAWGSLTNIQNQNGDVLTHLVVFDRGYTGHEHLHSVALIHMNGRLYDPMLHRFLQPDNFVQDPTNTQNYNRYGYVMNNPLFYSDPSGEWVHIVVGAVVGGVFNWAANGFQFNAAGLAYFGTGAAAGAVTALTGNPYGGAAILGAGNSITTQLATTGKVDIGQVFQSTITSVIFAGIGAQASAAIGAVGIIPGMLSGSAVSTTLGIIGNIVSGQSWDTGIGFNALMGAAGGAISGGYSAKASGSGIWFGTAAPKVPVTTVSTLTASGVKNGSLTPPSDAKLPSTTQTTTKPTTESQTVVALPKDGGYVDVSKTEFGRVVLENTSNNNKTLNINIKSGHTPMDVYNEMLTLQGMDKISLPSTSGSYHSFTNSAGIKYSIYYGGNSNPNGFTIMANFPKDVNKGVHFLKIR